MTIVSYAQNQEDVLLWRALKDVDAGFYVDVGANDPVDDSVTKVFYDRGWHGINVEPSQEYFDKLQSVRTRDVTLLCAAGDSDGNVTFYEAKTRGWSSSDAAVGEYYLQEGLAEAVEVEQLTLNTILTQHAPSDIHFLKIDVEGAEATVLKGLDLSRFRPWVIMVELLNPITQQIEAGQWEEDLLAQGYSSVFFDGLNRYYLAQEQASRAASFAAPPNVLDDYKTHAQAMLEAEKNRLDDRIADLEAALREAKNRRNDDRIADLEAALQKAENNRLDERIADLETALQEAENNRLDDRIEGLEAALRENELFRQLMSESCGEKQGDVGPARAQDALFDAITSLVRQQELEADDLRGQLNGQQNAIARLEASLSWRLTRPLRKVNVMRIDGMRSLRPKVGQQLRRGLARMVDATNRVPAVRRTGMTLLRRFPSLEYRLRRALNAYRMQRAGEPVVIDMESIEIATGPTGATGSAPFALPESRGVRVLYVFVDHTSKFASNTGVQRVTRGLSEGLIKQGEKVRFVRWHPESQQCILLDSAERAHLSNWGGPEMSEDEKDIYPDPGAPQMPVPGAAPGRNHWLIVPEVSHITFHPEPVTLDLFTWARTAGLKIGCIFYDAIPLRRPELAEIAERHAQYMRQLLLADVIWPISTWSAVDLVAYWRGLEKAAPATMPEVTPILLSGEAVNLDRVTEAGKSHPQILCIGSIEERKNQLGLIRAFESYVAENPGTDWQLTLVGNLNPTLADQIGQATRKGSRIRHLGHVTDEELVALYKRCAFTVFPSVEEGFGLPILESLWNGKPCLCADFGSMAEVAEGGGCLTVDTRDTASLKAALLRLIEDRDLRSRLTEEALNRSFKSWADYAGEIVARIDLDGDPVANLGPVYCWIDATVEFSQNTGIQRVARQVARALIERGVALIPAKWDPERGGMGPVTPQDLAHFAKWNGPPADSWHPWRAPDTQERDGQWLLFPELPLNRSEAERQQVMDQAAALGLKSCAIFFDAIPWKMRTVYPHAFAEALRAYMTELGDFDLILPISEYSRHDLLDFLGGGTQRLLGLEKRVIAAPLAGEFTEATRVTEMPERREGPVRILTVGTVEPRKNHERLLRAFVASAEKSEVALHLTIAGGSHSIEPALADRVRAFVDEHNTVDWEETVDDTRLCELYAGCDFTVYPSVEEGFGLPIVESLWNGRPCVAADFGAMKEIADGGGCLPVDVRDEAALADAIVTMANDRALRDRLSEEAITRDFKTWDDYALEVASRMAEAAPRARTPAIAFDPAELQARSSQMRMAPRPKLSVCISTYNRAEWLATSLRNWARMYPEPLEGVEFLVCDNASTDNTSEVVADYEKRADFTYHRNVRNVGMLGNLRATANHARGDYVWILGDDDLIMPGAVERVLTILGDDPDLELVYLNYAYSREEDARKIGDFDDFFASATPIAPPGPDMRGPIHEICAENENFFTAIYTLVFRRDHALRAYSQDTSGRPFSSMLTCIPTTAYVLDHMMDSPGYWIGAPQLVVNLNVSWMKYAPLWILERIPEVYETAELKGVSPEKMDHWRRHSLPGVVHYFQEVYESDPLGNGAYFSPERLVRRFKHLPEFQKALPTLRAAYERAFADGNPNAGRPPSKIFTTDVV